MPMQIFYIQINKHLKNVNGLNPVQRHIIFLSLQTMLHQLCYMSMIFTLIFIIATLQSVNKFQLVSKASCCYALAFGSYLIFLLKVTSCSAHSQTCLVLVEAVVSLFSCQTSLSAFTFHEHFSQHAVSLHEILPEV